MTIGTAPAARSSGPLRPFLLPLLALLVALAGPAFAYDHRLDAEDPLEVAQEPAPPAPIEEPSVLRADAQGPLSFGPSGGAFDRTMEPLFHAAQSTSDHLYDALRSYVFKPILPVRLGQDIAPSPDGDSYGAFKSALREKEQQYAERLRETYPVAQFLDAGAIGPRTQLWQEWAMEEQRSVFFSAFGDALASRYRAAALGSKSDGFIADSSNWNAGTFAMAALIGGGFAYANGIHTSADAGPARFYFDLRAARLWQRAASTAGSTGVGDVAVGFKNVPLRLTSSWGLESGRLRDELIGLQSQLKF